MKWKMMKTEEKVAEVLIYGDISTYNWWDEDVTPQSFNDELRALGDDIDVLNVRINSNGGSVFAGVAIHSMLKRHKARKKVYIDGLAASIASIIAMAGDEIIMPKGSMLMIHNPWTWGSGNANDFRKLADDLDVIAESMKDIYESRTGVNREELTALLDAETWLNATDAVARGFATHHEEDTNPVAASLRGKTAIINGVEMNWSMFKNAPKLPEEKVAEPDATAALRQEIEQLKAEMAQMKQQAPPQAPLPAPAPTPAAKLRDIDLEMRILELSQYNL